MNTAELNIHHIPRRIFRLLAGMAICAIAAMILLSFWMAETVDDVAAEKNKKLVTITLNHTINNLAVLTGDYADWDRAYEWITARDDAAVYENIGSTAGEWGNFGQLMIVDAQQQPLYNYVSGKKTSDLSQMLPDIASKYALAVKETPLLPYETASGIELIDGASVIVSAGRVLPELDEDIYSENLPFLITLVWMDDGFIERLGNSMLIDGLHISQSVMPGPNSLPLFDLNGEQVSNLVWLTASPGTDMLMRSIGIILTLSFLLIVGSLIVARFSSRQAHDFLQAHTLARTDALTGLLNRTGLMEIVSSESMKEHINSGHLAVLYIDVDKFKQFNDTYGHDAGDIALRKVADRLQLAVRKTDFVVRMGGDEFVAILIDPEPISVVEVVKGRLLQEAMQEVHIDHDTHVSLHLSIGAALANAHTDWRTLVMQADTAMYSAKQNQSGFELFSSLSSPDPGNARTNTI